MSEHGGKVNYFPLDIRDAMSIEENIENIFNEGPLDGLVNNAAGNFISRTKDLSPNGFNAIASIVFHGTFYITNAVGKRWLELGHKGSIVSILATWVWTGSPFVVPSAMSKSGINAMTKSLAVEWGPHGIRLNSIAPGPFPTEGAWARLMPQTGDKKSDISEDAERSNVPLGRVGKMDELGNLATFLMADGCEYLTGQTIAIDGAQYITGGGTFSMMSSFKDEDWEAIKNTIKGSNEKDKKQRTV
jgi:NAD(P)-dependent dehydrogenase (short-subunit alcohol dehydrogenase family)